MPQRAIVIRSPHAGRSGKLVEVMAHLKRMEVEVVDTFSIADLDSLPARGITWKESGIDVAVAAGGDGLVGGVITQIAGSGLPLAILPMGTSNDTARALCIPQDLRAAAQVIVEGTEQEVDIGVALPAGQVPYLSRSRQSGSVLEQDAAQKYGYFAHALTVGVNVQFARIATNMATRQRFGRMTYSVAAVETWLTHDTLDIQLEFEGLAMPATIVRAQASMPPAPATSEPHTTLRGRALQVAVINTPIFGGQRELVIPGSSFTDRLLDIVVIERLDVGAFGKNIVRNFSPGGYAETLVSQGGKHSFPHHPAELTGIPGIHHVQAHGVTITTSVDPQKVTLDGEIRGQTPMYVCVADERLRVKVPAQEE